MDAPTELRWLFRRTASSPRRTRLRHALAARFRIALPVLIGVLGSVGASISAQSPPDDETERATEPARPGITEKITVTAARLPDRPDEAERVPAHVTVIDRERIESSGARTLQELLSLESGVILYDQVGNDLQTTLDLRGFADGSGTRVYLDGAPLNDPRNNSLALYLIPLDALERVEIARGSAATLAGGGAEAGVIHLTSRRADAFGGSISVGAGSDHRSRLSGEVGNRFGPWEFFLSGSRSDDDGFRENAGGKMHRLSGSVGLDLGGERRLALSLFDSSAKLGNPGALTVDEFEQTPQLAPANQLDFSDERFDEAILNFRGPLTDSLSLALNLFRGERDAGILTTGRAAADYGGFFLDSATAMGGSTIQLTRSRSGESGSPALVVGMEWLDGRTDASGFATPPEDPGAVDPEDPSTQNRTDRRTLAFYLQQSWRPAPEWSLTAGLRLDRDRVGYDEAVPVPSNAGTKRFSELSARAGATWTPTPGHAFHLSYGEAFLPPTVEQLFAFPGFGSNSELRPEDSSTYEVGYRGRWKERCALDVALFLVDTTDEIIFDPDSPQGQFGANVNAGRTRRTGVESKVRGTLSDRLSAYLSWTLTDAELREGPDRGNRVPLVPRNRLSGGLDLQLPELLEGLGMRVDALYVGEQVLDNDELNEQDRLSAYTRVDLRLHLDLSGRTNAAGTVDGNRFRLFAEVTNLLDESYATRGIYAWNFAAEPEQYETFLTPAPGRRFLVGGRWSF